MDASEEVKRLRTSYESGTLEAEDLREDPIELFGEWLGAAIEAGAPEPHAMTLSTVTSEGQPAARMVLLRGLDPRGFAFYTNLESAKGAELAAHPRAALVFYWHAIHRQVRVTGTVERVSREESAGYFATRPRGHQLAAWASRQSRPVASRANLNDSLAEAEARFPDEVPLPEFWGGFRVRPERIEFWQGRKNRMHDRFLYSRAAEGWTVSRMAP